MPTPDPPALIVGLLSQVAPKDVATFGNARWTLVVVARLAGPNPRIAPNDDPTDRWHNDRSWPVVVGCWRSSSPL